MEIHSPESSVHSFKDFAVHIAIVTCGILIALGLEGIREAVHNHHLLIETRESVHSEMGINRDYAAIELKRVILYRDELNAMVQAMPKLAQEHPAEFRARLQKIKNPGYIFASNAWTSALSTGALATMSPGEVLSYAYATEGIKTYTMLQATARAQEASAKAYFMAHPSMTADQAAEGLERLILFYDAEESLAFFGPQMQGDIGRAFNESRRR